MNELLTPTEWNEKLDYQIVDWDGFREEEDIWYRKMTQEEFEKRAVYSTRKFTVK